MNLIFIAVVPVIITFIGFLFDDYDEDQLLGDLPSTIALIAGVLMSGVLVWQN